MQHGSPWTPFRAESWKRSFPEFNVVIESEQRDNEGKVLRPAIVQEMEITFRDSGDASALVDILFGTLTNADKEVAVAKLVVSSIIDPPMALADFASLSLRHKLALFTAIMERLGSNVGPDFSVASPDGATAPEKVESTTPAGGSGEQRKFSVTVAPKT